MKIEQPRCIDTDSFIIHKKETFNEGLTYQTIKPKDLHQKKEIN